MYVELLWKINLKQLEALRERKSSKFGWGGDFLCVFYGLYSRMFLLFLGPAAYLSPQQVKPSRATNSQNNQLLEENKEQMRGFIEYKKRRDLKRKYKENLEMKRKFLDAYKEKWNTRKHTFGLNLLIYVFLF